MIPPRFEYLAPTTLDEAVSLLHNYGPDAKLLAGGQSLIPLMKFQLVAPSHIIDLNRVPGLAYTREGDGFLRIGGLTREVYLEESELIRTRYPIIQDTATVIADPLVRNLATVGGNLAHGDPANDHPATMLALDAEVVAVGPAGERSISVADFFQGPLTTTLAHDEILTEIRLPTPPPGSGGAYLKLKRKVGDYAIAGVATMIVMQDGLCCRAGIGLTNVGPTPIKARNAETFLEGKQLDEEVIQEAGHLAAQESQPSADLRGPEEYKRDMVRVLTVKALRLALERARQGIF
jgi:aerobic carbon-monoxide dehydrogenase medium subunit